MSLSYIVFIDEQIYLGDFSEVYENDIWQKIDLLETTNEIDYFDESLPFTGMKLEFANFQGVELSRSVLISAKMKLSNFSQSRLWGSEIISSDFRGTDFQEANLDYIEIKNSNFTSTKFNLSSIFGGYIENSDFSFADFRGANLKKCNFENTNLNMALFDQSTQLPFNREIAISKGMSYVEEKYTHAS